MRPDRTLLCSFIAVALLLSCSASGAREGSAAGSGGATAPAAAPAAAPPAGGTQYREGLPGVDLSSLDAAGKERALDLLNKHKCDCGCPFESIAECRVKDQKCDRSPVLARMVVDAVRAGKTDAEIAAALTAPAAQAAPVAPSGPVEISMEGAQIKGKASARATLVEYADFQCTYCVRAKGMVDQLLAKYPDDLKYVFKQLPLTSIHRFAEPAARASFAAGRQGKFWEMHDILFANSRALDDASLKKYAQELGLDMAKFERDFTDPAVAEAVSREAAEAQRVGVQGTPTFFVNGVKVPYADVNTIGRMIEAARSGGDIAAIATEINQRLAEQQTAQRKAAAERAAQDASRVVAIDTTGAPFKGDAKAPVTIVEFGDFQCPYCAQAQPLIKQVLEAYPGKVKLVFKHLPLNMHPNAVPAAIASLEAMEQGKFWEMHDLLFQNYSQLSRENLTNFARQVGLNMEQFEKAMQAQEHKHVIDKDVADSERAGVGFRTPSFYVNGKRVMQRDFPTFQRMIQEALAGGSPRASN